MVQVDSSPSPLAHFTGSHDSAKGPGTGTILATAAAGALALVVTTLAALRISGAWTGRP